MPRRKNDADTKLCERDAIERAKNGDPAGMERLYELHQRRIYSLCLRHTGNTFDADDVTQDVFIQVFKKVHTFRGDAQFASWLYKVALNFVRLHARQQRRHGRFLKVDCSEQQLCSVRSRSCNPARPPTSFGIGCWCMAGTRQPDKIATTYRQVSGHKGALPAP